MRGPNSVSIRGKPASIVALRRSPRFIHPNKPKSVDPETPKPESSRVLVCTSSRKSYIDKSRKLRRSEASEVKESHIRSRSLNELDTGKRRSARLNGAGEESRCFRRSPRFSIVGALDWELKQGGCTKERESGRRQNSVCELDNEGSRSCIRGNAGSRNRSGKCRKKVSEHSSSDELVAGNVSICSSDSGKRVTRSASRATAHKDNEVLTPVGKVYPDIVICIMADPTRSVDKKEVDNQVDKKQVGAKRKNTSTGDAHPALQGRMSRPEMKNIYAAEEPPKVQGWTREQELALQGAYFSAKPTPQFWKKVAKMVPGKSAQECFEKIHSDNLTPPQPQRRSKAKRTSLLSLPLSASKLLSPLRPISKKLRHAKGKHYCSYKDVRQLLYKQAKTDQKSGADLFSVLEPSFGLSPQLVQDAAVVSHPDCSNGEQPSSALRNNPSRLGDLNRASFNSPPVLKQIKNKALHEKYIDQLHIRETKRNVASLRATQCLKGKKDAKENQVLKEEAIERAKSSLIVNARSAINQFLQLQSTVTGDLDDANDDVDDNADDEKEDSF